MTDKHERAEQLAASRRVRAEAIARRRLAPSSLWLTYREGFVSPHPADPEGIYVDPILRGFADEDEARSFAILTRCALVKLPVTEDYREPS